MEQKRMKSHHVVIKKLKLLNRYYKITKFYPFLKNIAKKAILVLIILGLILFVLDYFFLDFNAILTNLVATYPPKVIFSFFLLSETILGIIPPDIFIAWASKSGSPWLFLFILATLSYLGGIFAYFIGNRLFLIPVIKNQIENKIAVHIDKLRKWGGFFVVIGAMLPIPHSVVSLACGLIKYEFKHYLFWALFRYFRFYLYALLIFRFF